MDLTTGGALPQLAVAAELVVRSGHGPGEDCRMGCGHGRQVGSDDRLPGCNHRYRHRHYVRPAGGFLAGDICRVHLYRPDRGA